MAKGTTRTKDEVADGGAGRFSLAVVSPTKNKVEKYKSREKRGGRAGPPRVVSGDKSG